MRGMGTFRNTFRRAKQLFKKQPAGPVTREYADPVLAMPHTHNKARFRFKQLRNVRNKIPSCDPGTISYHDRLTRHFGHKKALEYGRLIQSGKTHLLPTDEDFLNAKPFGWVKPHL